jgi:hypothetical protein
LHSAVGIAHKEGTEIALVHLGARVGLIGIHDVEIPKYTLVDILEQYPLHGFKNAFVDLVIK